MVVYVKDPPNIDLTDVGTTVSVTAQLWRLNIGLHPLAAMPSLLQLLALHL